MSRVQRIASRLKPMSQQMPDSRGRALAAVALILTRDPEAMLVIKRAVRADDPWSGQLGLPGGRMSREDPDLFATAVRETREEVGLSLHGDHLLGVMDDHAPSTRRLPPIVVRPFVFLLPDDGPPPPLKRNAEVSDAAWVSLDDLLAPGIYDTYRVEAGDLIMKRPGYRLSLGILWGMTERILTPALRGLE